MDSWGTTTSDWPPDGCHGSADQHPLNQAAQPVLNPLILLQFQHCDDLIHFDRVSSVTSASFSLFHGAELKSNLATANNPQEGNACCRQSAKLIYSAACINGSVHAAETRKEAMRPRE